MQSDRDEKSNVQQAWGQWLSELYPWQWFVTLTFRDPPPGSTWTRPGWTYAKKAWRAFVDRVSPEVGELAWVRVFEIQKGRGVPHIHALVGGLEKKRYADLGTWYWKICGMCRILEYDPSKDAAYYLAKYLVKDQVDIEFSQGLRKT